MALLTLFSATFFCLVPGCCRGSGTLKDLLSFCPRTQQPPRLHGAMVGTPLSGDWPLRPVELCKEGVGS